jgi:hypothetical protein
MFVMKKFTEVKVGIPKYVESTINCNVRVNALLQICGKSARE